LENVNCVDVTCTEHPKGKTVTAMDVVYALMRKGLGHSSLKRVMYSFKLKVRPFNGIKMKLSNPCLGRFLVYKTLISN
jgi:hypothetical protein